MDKTRIVNTDLFEVKSATGRIYEICEQTIQIKATCADGIKAGWISGNRRYKVRSGGSANKLSHTEFHILASGEDANRL